MEPPGHPPLRVSDNKLPPLPLGIVASVSPLSLEWVRAPGHAWHSPGLLLNQLSSWAPGTLWRAGCGAPAPGGLGPPPISESWASFLPPVKLADPEPPGSGCCAGGAGTRGDPHRPPQAWLSSSPFLGPPPTRGSRLGHRVPASACLCPPQLAQAFHSSSSVLQGVPVGRQPGVIKITSMGACKCSSGYSLPGPAS